MKKFWPMLAALTVIAGCNPAADTKAAEQGVTAFHASLNAGRFDEIYTRTDADFKAISTQQDFTKLLDVIHRKLGNFKSGTTVGWNVNVNNGEHYVTLNRKADYERGPADEQFIFKLDGDKPLLVGYHINSNTLITG